MYKLLTRITPHGARVLFQGDMSEVAAGGGGSALRYTQPMRAGGSAHNNREAVRVGTDTAHLQMGMK